MDKIKHDAGIDNEIDSLIDYIRNLYGFDLGLYRRASLVRRITRIVELNKLNLHDLKHSLVNNRAFFTYFLEEVTVNVTEMFRDPSLYVSLQNNVLPYLNTYPRIKCWSAGCSTGEEAYSIAIFLNNNGLYNKSLIYGTDINGRVLDQARKGIYALQKVKNYAENYRKSKLEGELLGHFTVSYDAAAIRHELKSNILFSQHNLVSDRVFNEFQLIFCRNVFIYFEPELQKQIVQLFYDSLCPFGYLCIGAKENLSWSDTDKRFKIIDKTEHIYQKIV